MVRTESRPIHNPENQTNSANVNEGVDDSRIVLMIQENPNMPDSALVPNPDAYPEEDMNIINDEESEGTAKNSVNRLHESSSGSDKNKQNDKASSSEGEAEVKPSKNS